jgi:thioredoxin reductase
VLPDIDVVIVGSGPYGLSIAAHLARINVEHCNIGIPLYPWRAEMPRGMLLKSEGFASNLYDPDGQFTLAHYCAKHGIAYADIGLPVAVETFAAYGAAFQRRFVPTNVDDTIARLDRGPHGFTVTLASGDTLTCRKVVLATGLSYYDYIPSELCHLPPELLSHSSQCGDTARFKGQQIVVVGAGASAIDLACTLLESGTEVRLIARGAKLSLHLKMQLPRSLWQRVCNPISGIGPSWRSRFYCDAPILFRSLPASIRLHITREFLGPAGGWFMQDRARHIPVLLGYRVTGASVDAGRARLKLQNQDGTEQDVHAEHVISATGFKVDLRRLSFLSRAVLMDLKAIDYTPVLSSFFESTVPGLYLVGPASANCFGPVMRFTFGARFTARRISHHLSLKRDQTPRPPLRPTLEAQSLLRTTRARRHKDHDRDIGSSPIEQRSWRIGS